MKIELTKTQESVLEIIKEKRHYGIFLNMGVGKTALILSLIDYIVFERLEDCNTLILAPSMVAKELEVWQDEIKKWEDFEFFDYILLDGTAQKRKEKVTRNKPTITLMSDSLIPWWKETYKNLAMFDMIVIDESSRFKNPTSKKFKSLHEMIDLDIHRVYELSGTPTPQGYLDLWSQIFLLDKGNRLGDNFYRFRENWFINYAYKWYLPKNNKKIIINKLKDICVFAEGDVKLPKRHDINVMLDFPEDKAKLFKEFKNSYILDMGDKEITVLDKKNLVNKCLQLSNGAYYKGREGGYEMFDDTKIRWVKQFLKDHPDENVMIFYSFKFDKFRLMEIDGAEEIKDSFSKNKWNLGGIRLGVISPYSFQYGGNLQFGGHIVMWFGLKFALENFLQSNKRVWRPGQTHEVYFYYIMMNNTFDEYALKVLNGKDNTEKDFLHNLKLIPDKL